MAATTPYASTEITDDAADQLPPATAFLNLADVPWHNLSVPVIGAGVRKTVMLVVTLHPVGNV